MEVRRLNWYHDPGWTSQPPPSKLTPQSWLIKGFIFSAPPHSPDRWAHTWQAPPLLQPLDVHLRGTTAGHSRLEGKQPACWPVSDQTPTQVFCRCTAGGLCGNQQAPCRETQPVFFLYQDGGVKEEISIRNIHMKTRSHRGTRTPDNPWSLTNEINLTLSFHIQRERKSEQQQ